MIMIVSAWIAQHRKLIAALAGAAVTVIIQVWGTNTPWVTALVLIATAAGVYRAPNADPPAPAAGALPRTPGGRGEASGLRIIPAAADPEPAVTTGTLGPPPSGT